MDGKIQEPPKEVKAAESRLTKRRWRRTFWKKRGEGSGTQKPFYPPKEKNKDA